MPVVSPLVLQIGDTYWELMKVARWEEPSPQTVPATVLVHFIDLPDRTVTFDKATFEMAMQNALDSL